MVTLTWAPYDSQAYQDVASYKHEAPSSALAARRLQLLLYFAMISHTGCIAPSFNWASDAIAYVPSTAGRVGDHPLLGILRVFPDTIRRVHPIYLGQLNPDRNARRLLRPELWTFDPAELSGVDRVLLFDDSWVTGGHVQSVASALKQAGVSEVVVITLGRAMNPNWSDNSAYARDHPVLPYDPAICPVHGVRHP